MQLSYTKNLSSPALLQTSHGSVKSQFSREQTVVG